MKHMQYKNKQKWKFWGETKLYFVANFLPAEPFPSFFAIIENLENAVLDTEMLLYGEMLTLFYEIFRQVRKKANFEFYMFTISI